MNGPDDGVRVFGMRARLETDDVGLFAEVIEHDLNLPIDRALPFRPIFHMQIGNLAEIPQIPRDQSGVRGKCDGSDFEIHRSDPDFECTETSIRVESGPIERKDTNSAVVGNMLEEPDVDIDLTIRIFSVCNFREPSSNLFFVCDDSDGGRFVGRRLSDSGAEAQTFWTVNPLDEREQVGIENDHLEFLRERGRRREDF
jgi:hypothetical protein